MTALSQLALEFGHRPALSGEDFLVAPCNAEAVAWLDRWPDWPGPALVVHGPAGCGKTHLARVFQGMSGAKAIPHEMLLERNPFDLMGDATAVILDGAEEYLGAEEALLHLYNWVHQAGGRMLMTALRPPARWPVHLADLRSRLKAATAIGVGAPDDALIAAVLVKLFADRQLKVDEDVIGYMLSRMERTFDAARRLVEAVDARALAERRNITVPLVGRIFQDREDSPWI